MAYTGKNALSYLEEEFKKKAQEAAKKAKAEEAKQKSTNVSTGGTTSHKGGKAVKASQSKGSHQTSNPTKTTKKPSYEEHRGFDEGHKYTLKGQAGVSHPDAWEKSGSRSSGRGDDKFGATKRSALSNRNRARNDDSETRTSRTNKTSADIAEANAWSDRRYNRALDDSLTGRISNITHGSTKSFVGGQLSSVGTAVRKWEVDDRSILKGQYIGGEKGAKAYGTRRGDRLTESQREKKAEDTAGGNGSRRQGVSIKDFTRSYKHDYGENSLGQQLINMGDSLQASGQADIENAKKDLGTIGKVAVDLSSNAMMMAGDGLMNLIAPGAGLLSLGNRAGGMASFEGRQEGMNADQQYLYALSTSAVEMLSEQIGNGVSAFRGIYGKGAIDMADSVATRLGASRIVQDLFRNSRIGRNLVTELARLGVNMTEEGIEEVVADLAEPAMKYLITKDSGGQYDPATLKEMGYDYLIGSLMALAGGGGVDVARNLAMDTSASPAMVDGALSAASRSVMNIGLAQNEGTTANYLANAAQEQINKGGIVTEAQIRHIIDSASKERVRNEESRTEREDELVAEGVRKGEIETAKYGNTLAEDVEQRGYSEAYVKSIEKAYDQVVEAMGDVDLNDPITSEIADSLTREMVGSANTADIDTILANSEAKATYEKLTGETLPLSNTKAREVLESKSLINAIANNNQNYQMTWSKNAKEIAIAQNSNHGKNGQQVFLENYTKGEEVVGKAAYDDLFNKIYTAGTISDISLNEVVDMVNQTVEGSQAGKEYFTEARINQIFSAGRADTPTARTVDSVLKKTANKGKKPTKRMGKLTIDESAMDKVTDSQKKVLERLAMNGGVEIRIVDHIKNDSNNPEAIINGKYQGGVIYIAADSENPLITVAKHELTHWIKENNPEGYRKLENFVFKKWYHGNQNEMQAAIREYSNLYKGRTIQEVKEEIIADSTEAFFTDDEAVREVIEYDRSLGKTIRNGLRQILKDLAELRQSQTDGLEHGYGDFLKDLNILTEAESLWAEAFGEAVKGTPTKGTVEFSTEAKQQLEELGASVTEGGTVAKNSLTSWKATDIAKLRKMLIEAGYSAKEANKWIRDVNSVAAVIAADRGRLDYEADAYQDALKPNQEYFYTLDLSTLCAKRRLYQGTYNAIMKRLPNTAMMPEDNIRLRKMMADMKKEVPCGICYEESRKKNEGKFAETWLNGQTDKEWNQKLKDYEKKLKKYEQKLAEYNALENKGKKKPPKPPEKPERWIGYANMEHEDSFIPTLADVTTTTGRKKLRDEGHSEALESYLEYQKGRGSANPKVSFTHTDYRGDILRMTEKDIENVKHIGGLRIQSFSDFETIHVIDMMQAVMDMASKKLTAQAYTKVPAFADIFGGTGIKINLSLIGKVVNGKLTFDSKEGIDPKEAFRLRKKYSDNVGTILVGANVESILAAWADPRIDMVIPFHRSGWSTEEFEQLGLGDYEDFQEYQAERYLDGSPNGKSLADAKMQEIYSEDYWNPNKTGKENAEAYLKLCAKKHYRPVFYNFLHDNGDGTWSLQEDGSTDGYWKSLIDYKMYNNDGVGVRQEVVKPIFNMRAANKAMAEFDGDPNTLPIAEDVVDEFVKDYENRHKGTKFSMSATDSDGNKLSKGQQEFFKDSKVRDENGNLLVMYHGTEWAEWTGEDRFTVFDPALSDDGISLFFTDKLSVAKGYSGVYETYAPQKAGKPTLSKVQKALDRLGDSYHHYKVAKTDNGYEVYRYDVDWNQNANGEWVISEEKISDPFNYEAPDIEGIVSHINEEFGGESNSVSTNYKVYLNLTNPLVVDAEGRRFDQLSELGEGLEDTRDYAKYAKENGYDGVIFNNIVDTHNYASVRESYEQSTVVIAFDSNQVKSVANKNPTSNSDIRYSLSTNEEQQFSSADTSINSSKVPAVFGKVNWKSGTVNVDIGGGRFDTAQDYLKPKGVENLVYDPYNRSKEHNQMVSDRLDKKKADTATISNVLNVIQEKGARLEVLNNAKENVKPNGEVYITVYEGNGSGIGAETTKGYQLNMKLKGYLSEVKEVFPDAYIRRGMIVAPNTTARYQLTETEPTRRAKEESVDDLHKRIERLKAEFKRTDLMTPKEDQTRIQASKLLRRYESNLAIRDNVVQTFNQLFRLYKQGKIDTTEAINLAKDQARQIVDNISAVHEEGKETFDAIKQTLKDYRIGVTPEMKAEIPDYDAFARRNRARLRLYESDTSDLGSIYEYLRDSYNTDLLPEANTQGEMLQNLADFLDTKGYSYEQYDSSSESAQELVDDVAYDLMVTAAELQTKKTFADRKYEEKVRAVQRERDRQRAVREAKRERREESETRTKLLNIAKRLNRVRTNDATKELIQSYIGELDLVAKSMTGKTVTKLFDLYQWYDEQQKLDPYFYDSEVENKIKRLWDKPISSMDIEDVRDLLTTLQSIETSIRNANKFVESKQKKDTREAGLQVIKDVEKVKGINRESAFGNFDTLFINGTLSPIRQIRRMVGYRDNDPLYIAAEELADGQRKMLDYQMKAEAMFEPFLKDNRFVKGLNGKTAREIKLNGISDGKPISVSVTPDVAISLYLSSLNEDNMYHIRNGGVNIPDFKLYKDGKIKSAYYQDTMVKFTEAELRNIRNLLTDREKDFADTAHEYYNKVAPQAINRVSNILRGYSIANVRNYFPIHVDKTFLETNFEAIKFDGSIESQGSLQERVKHSPLPIEINGIVNTIMRSINENSLYVGMAIPVRNMNKLLGVSQLTWTEKDRGGRREVEAEYNNNVQKAITKKWGTEGMKYIENLMADLQTRRSNQDDWEKKLNKLRSNYAGAVLTWNLSVAFKQAASYPAAMAVLGYAPTLKAMGKFGMVDLDKIAEYTPLQWVRSKGSAALELGDIVAGRSKSLVGKATSLTVKVGDREIPILNWIQGIDLLTTRKLWKASEIYVQMHNKNLAVGSDEYYKAVAEIYNRVIEETQPNYTLMQRPQLLRSDRLSTQILNMFKTQPYQNFNILYDAIGNYNAKVKDFKNHEEGVTKEDVKEAAKNMRMALVSQFLQQATFASMIFAWNLFRGNLDKWKDEEEDKVTFWSFIKQLCYNMTSGTFSMLPLFSDAFNGVARLFNDDYYYGYQSVTDATINDIFDSLYHFGKLIGDAIDYFAGADEPTEGEIDEYGLEEKKGSTIDADTLLKELKTVAQEIGRFTGVPADNIMKTFDAVYRWTMIAANGKYVGEYYAAKETLQKDSEKKQILFKAYRNDPKQYEKLRQMMIEDGLFDDEEDLNSELDSWRVDNMTQEEIERYKASVDKIKDTSAWQEATADEKEDYFRTLKKHALGITDSKTESVQNYAEKNEISFEEAIVGKLNDKRQTEKEEGELAEYISTLSSSPEWQNASDKQKEYYTDALREIIKGDKDSKRAEAIQSQAVDGKTVEDVLLDSMRKEAESIEAVSSSELWQGASEDDREAKELLLRKLALGIEDSNTTAVTKKAVNGVTPEQVILYQLALKRVDQPTASGKYGSYTNAEKQEAMALLLQEYGLTVEQQKTITGMK